MELPDTVEVDSYGDLWCLECGEYLEVNVRDDDPDDVQRRAEDHDIAHYEEQGWEDRMIMLTLV